MAGVEIRYLLDRPVKLDVRLRVQGFTVLLGASGAGKTSLLKAIAGLLPARGRPFDGLPPERRPVGYLPQHYALFPHLRAWQNVAFALRGNGDEKRRRALEWLDRVGIAHLADRFPSELSGGQQQRVALARALAREPQLLLLDEPTSALDPSTREAVMAELVAVIRRAGAPVLAVSHDPAVARIADRVAVLAGGKVVQEGPPDEVLSRPASLEVARLVGIANLFAGRVVEVSAPWVLLQTPLGLLRAPYAPWMAPGAGVVVAVHSRDLLVEPPFTEPGFTEGPLAAAPGGAAANRVRGRVEAIWRHGPQVRVEVQAGVRLEVDMPRPSFSRLGLEVGQQVCVLVEWRVVHVLPDGSGSGGHLAERRQPPDGAPNG